jgi:hypothetical protein
MVNAKAVLGIIFPAYLVPSGDSTNSATAIHRNGVLGVQVFVHCPRSHTVIVQPGTRHSSLNDGTDHFFSRTGPQYLPLGCSWAFKDRVKCPKEGLTGMQTLCLCISIADVRGKMDIYKKASQCNYVERKHQAFKAAQESVIAQRS